MTRKNHKKKKGTIKYAAMIDKTRGKNIHVYPSSLQVCRGAREGRIEGGREGLGFGVWGLGFGV